ncbi:MAG: hypothetical protein MJ246_01620 [Clostridia bacterium]|nr:hypothetical protein [Clostridia bacterium]
MDKEKFIRTYKINSDKVDILFNNYDMNDEKNIRDIDFLMPVIMKIDYLKNKFPEVVQKDLESGNLKIMAENSKEYKQIYSLLNSGASIDAISNLMIESQKNAVHELFADLNEYYFTAYSAEIETFGGKMPERRPDEYMYHLFDSLVDILI